MNKDLEILKRFLDRQKNDISKQGYKDDSPYRNNPSNTIYGTPQGTPITMKGVSTPLIGMDEFGNKQHMMPGQEYQFPGSQVTEMPIAQVGKNITESTSVYKKPFNDKELKNILKDNKELVRTGDIKNPRAEANKFEKYLPTKETANFFKKLKKDVGPELFKEALKIQHERGNPAVNVGTNKGLPFHNKRNYNPFTNEVNIPKPLDDTSDLKNYLKEVAHAGQPLSEVIPRFLKNDIPGYIKAYTTEGNTENNIQSYIYDNPNTVENYTHHIIQPKLEERVYSSFKIPMSEAEEAEDVELYRQYFNKPMYQMGGAGMMYADRNYQMGGNLPFAQVGKETSEPFKIRDERYEGLAVRDNLEDRNVLGFNNAEASRTVNKLQQDLINDKLKLQRSAKNPKVVIFAESPSDQRLGELYNKSLNIPHLKKIQDEFFKTKQQIDSIKTNDKNFKSLTKEAKVLQNKFESYTTNLAGPDAKSQRLFDEFNDAQRKANDYENVTLYKKILPYSKKLDDITEKFYDEKVNPVTMDSTFIKEGENVKKFYNRTQPGVKVDVVPLYKNKKLLQDKLKGMTQFDKVAFFAHSGQSLSGIPNDTIAKYLDKSKVKDCYFGSCYYEEYLNNSSLKDLKNKTLNYRPGQSKTNPNFWYGFNPDAKTFDEGMWSRTGTDHYNAKVTPIKQGVTHIVKKSQEGGDVDLDAMRGMMKSKIGMGNALGHPAIKRMSQFMPKTGMTPEGMGTHYMSSMGEYAVPLLQDTGKDQLEYFENPRPSREDIKFNSPEEAQYFAEHYKEVAPMSTIYNGLQGYQGGGEKTVKYGTPEYEAAYNRGDVITEDGQRSPIALDEVIVQNNYKRPRGFWEQYRDKIVDENKDASLMGAIVGTPISAVFSLPQLAMTKGFTGKMQRPSEAWGFENNEGWFDSPSSFGKHLSNLGLDIVTDPANLIGAGILTKENVLSKIAASKNSGLLSNAYKYNPLAFKPQQGKIYRQVGKPGFDDALIEGKVYDKGQKQFLENNPNINYLDEYNDAVNAKGLYFKKPSSAPFFSKDELFFPIDRKATGKGFKKTANSDAEYLIEGSVPDEALLPRYMDKYLKPGEKTNTFVLRPEYNNLENFKTYKRDWLQGYKEVPKPTSTFKSEIDWENWVKTNNKNWDAEDIKNINFNKQEYDVIEQTSKANGSWMKNPDGSVFQGTPEQFVQQNSQNFKKAFSNTKVRDPKGNIQITNHSTWDKFDEFDLNKFGRTDQGFYGKGAYFHPNTNTPKLYGDIDMNSYINIENPMPHENHFFFGREGKGSYWDSAKNEQVKIDDLGSLWKGKYDGYITPHGEYPLNDFNSTEYITNIPSNIKSAVGNNGMFDMTNPNIYKALVPGAIGVGALQQQKDGGVINNNIQQYQVAGTVKLKDERYDNRTVIENTQQYGANDREGVLLAIKERQDSLKDAHELKTTGQIKRPRSIHYNKLAPKQSTLTAQTKSNAELNGQLGLLERPLIYMANPEKLLGDLGVPGMETSELDRQAVMANRFNPNQSRLDRFINNAKLAAGYAPEAAINGALAAAFMPEGSGALGLVNETLNPLAGLKTSIAPKLRQGLRTAGPSLRSSIDNVGNASKNLEDLNYAKSWAKKYGYELPENLERIAQSDELTNRTVRGLANRHNTFVRGVSTNWDVIGQKNPEVLRHLESLGIDYINNPKQAAEYMATHIPGDTGYGRYGLQPGENALYLSNSVPTAEGYTYGNGYIVKTKRPTNFSSSNRNEWLTDNDFDAHLGFKGSPFGEGVVKNDYIKRFPTSLRETLAITGDPGKMSELQKAVKAKELVYNDLSHQSWRKYNDKIDLLKYKTDPVYRNKFIMDDAEDRFFLRNSPNIIDKINFKYLNTKRDLDQVYYNALPALDIVKGVYGDPDVWKAFGKNLFGKLDPFSHYALKGKEGEKMLEAIKSVKVNPETWENTSRAHINKYTNKLSRKEEGGYINDKYNLRLLNPETY